MRISSDVSFLPFGVSSPSGQKKNPRFFSLCQFLLLTIIRSIERHISEFKIMPARVSLIILSVLSSLPERYEREVPEITEPQTMPAAPTTHPGAIAVGRELSRFRQGSERQ